MIKVGFLISYDYELVFEALSLVYKNADFIFLAVDKDLKTWAGNTFSIDSSFYDKLNRIDTDNKIIIYQDSFYVSSLSPMECETRQRIMLSQRMGKGWLIQLDADEYIYQFEKIAHYLRKHQWITWFPQIFPVSFKGNLITLFKETNNQMFYIHENEEFPFITNTAFYSKARSNNKAFIHNLNIQVLHKSWARKEHEIKEKIENWGHKNDFNTESFFQRWRELNESNYKEYINFHPLSSQSWNKLEKSDCLTLTNFIQEFENKEPQKVVPFRYKHFFGYFIKKYFGLK